MTLSKRIRDLEDSSYLELISHLEQWSIEMCELWASLPGTDESKANHPDFANKMNEVFSFTGEDANKRHFAADWIDNHIEHFAGAFNEQSQ